MSDNQYKLVTIEGNEHRIESYGVHIATVYTTKDTYVFDIEQMVEAGNRRAQPDMGNPATENKPKEDSK